MAITTINITDPVSALVTKTNVISTGLGDVPTLYGGFTNAVAAINALNSTITSTSNNLQDNIDSAYNDLSGQISSLGNDFSNYSPVTISDTPPSSPLDGDLWYDASTNYRLYVWSSLSQAWVDTSPAVISSVYDALATQVSTLSGQISTLQAAVFSDSPDIGIIDLSALETTVTNQGTAISTLQSTVSGQGTDISSLQSTVSGQGTDISTLQSTVSTHGTDISTLQSTVSTHGTDISTLQTAVSDLEAGSGGGGGGSAPTGRVTNSLVVGNGTLASRTITTAIPANTGYIYLEIGGDQNGSATSSGVFVLGYGSGTSHTTVFPASGDNNANYTGTVTILYWT